MTRKKSSKDQSVGKKIKKARTDKKISLYDMANETGLSIEYIKELESGKAMPSVGTLLQISKSLQIDSGLLFKDQEANAESRVKAYEKRTDNYAYTALTPGAENKHLKAFRVVIDPMKVHEGVGYHHEGEEFVYVIAGTIEVKVGDHQNILKTNESLHFNSGIKHQLANISDEKAELVVVVYSP